MSTTLAYILIVTAAFLCSCQFLFQRKYNKTEGADVYAVLVLAFFCSVLNMAAAFAMSGFKHEFTLLPALITLLSALNSMAVALFSAKVFLVANMSVYSMFMMLGGMALPFVFGFTLGEELTCGKALCFVLIVVAMLINTDFKSKSSRAAIKYYAAIFVCNGLSGVFAATNQHLPNPAPSGTYLLMIGAWMFIICGASVLVLTLKRKRGVFVSPKNAVTSATLYATISSVSALLIFVALETLDASVQYPLITGGTMVFSTLICLVSREKLKARDIIAMIIATVSSVVVIL